MAKFNPNKVAEDAQAAIDQSEKVAKTLNERLVVAEKSLTEVKAKAEKQVAAKQAKVDKIKADLAAEEALVEQAKSFIKPPAEAQVVAVEGVPSEGAFGQF